VKRLPVPGFLWCSLVIWTRC